ncbi:DUF4157 domain-containing protein [Pendulispora rubella]|uniref:DUF4157 domain-containing protein n=1 Tax=Pendulispora rubella TaxID=2741070 RepID=A0ABZ2L9G7_9BACT
MDAVQRQCAACEEELDAALQRKPADAATAMTGGQAPGSVEHALRSPGRPLAAPAREFMELRFGRDFSNVRIHDDASAHASATALGARAYTVGKEVVFGANQYQPASADGRKLLAHELTHVVQQSGGSAVIERAPKHVARDVGGAERESGQNSERAQVQALQPQEIAGRWVTEKEKLVHVAADASNRLSAKQMYIIWLLHSKEEWSAAGEEVRRIESALRKADEVAFANKKMLFEQGARRDILGPEYEKARNRLATVDAQLSDLESVMAWLEARAVLDQHVTLAQVEAEASEHAKASAMYRRFAGPFVFGVQAAGAGMRAGTFEPAGPRTLWTETRIREARSSAMNPEVPATRTDVPVVEGSGAQELPPVPRVPAPRPAAGRPADVVVPDTVAPAADEGVVAPIFGPGGALKGTGAAYGEQLATRLAAAGRRAARVVRPLVDDLNAQSSMPARAKAEAAHAACRAQMPTWGPGPLVEMPNGDFVITSRQAMLDAPVIIVESNGNVSTGRANMANVENNGLITGVRVWNVRVDAPSSGGGPR